MRSRREIVFAKSTQLAYNRMMHRLGGKCEHVLSAVAVMMSLSACAAKTPDLSRRTPDASFRLPEEPGVVLVSAPEAGVVSGTEEPSPPPTGHGTAPAPTTPTGPREPERDAALRLLNGVIDADYVYFCAVDPDSGRSDEDAKPFPERGLRHGQSVWFSPTEEERAGGYAWDLVAAMAPLAEGISCAELSEMAAASVGEDSASAWDGEDSASVGDGGVQRAPSDGGASVVQSDAGDQTPDASAASEVPDAAALFDAGDAARPRLPSVDIPELRVVPFATLSPGALDELSSLLVAAGCVGGYPKDPEDVCGANFGRGHSTLTPIFATLSRLNDFGSVGLQLVNASAMNSATLRSEPWSEEASGSFFTVATRISRGQIAPTTVRSGIELETIGEPLSGVRLRVEEGDDVEPVFATDWQSVLDASGLQLEQSRAYTFVLTGSSRGDGRQFHESSLALIANDPVRQEVSPTPDGGQ